MFCFIQPKINELFMHVYTLPTLLSRQSISEPAWIKASRQSIRPAGIEGLFTVVSTVVGLNDNVDLSTDFGSE